MDARLLGPLEVRHSGSAIHLGGPRQRALLARLLLDLSLYDSFGEGFETIDLIAAQRFLEELGVSA